ncbi:MAG: hypothetical protein ACFFF9_07865 [Candidatus Thorarchaeota archaeon]
MRYIIICQTILFLIATVTTIAMLLVIGDPAVVGVLALLFYIYLVIASFVYYSYSLRDVLKIDSIKDQLIELII